MRELYHYTDAQALDAILASGLLRAHTLRVYRDLVPDASRSATIGPILWLTINPVVDGTVLAKLCRGDLSRLCRITVPGDYCDVGLADYCDAHRLDHEMLIPMVQTGKLCGSDYTTWRLHERDAPAEDWLRIERGASWILKATP